MNIKFLSGLAALSLMSGRVYYQGCPNRELENQYRVDQCFRLGFHSLWADYLSPNASAIEARGQELLKNWDSNSGVLDSRYKLLLPNGIESVVGPVPKESCLTLDGVRTLYNKMVSNISYVVGNWTGATYIEKAHAASSLRKDARQRTREKMCDQREVSILKERDRSIYGTATTNFAYMVGKYAKQVSEGCKNRACNIAEETCNAIIKASEKTSGLYNWIAKFFY